VFPVLLDYPELSPTRSAQYETAMKTENVAGYLYDFYRKERRGLVQAPIERWSLNRFSSRQNWFQPVSLSVDGWS